MSQDIDIQSVNTELPLIPNKGAMVLQSKIGADLKVFTWIEAYFIPKDGFLPQLAVWSGDYLNNDGKTKLVTPIVFSYSGQQHLIKGKSIESSGVDYLGNTITSTIIGSADGNINLVIVKGGMGGTT